jgi:hypothetical protein
MSNDFIQAADNEEVDGSGQSFIQSAGEFFGYGVTSSVISGGVGIWNSVKAIGNTMGADLAMTNEADVVQNLVGQEAHDYYLEHKVGADIGGLVVGSVGAGLVALRLFRGAQAMGNLAGTGRFGFTNALGVSNPDIVLASSQAQALRTAVQSNVAEFTWRGTAFNQALGWAARQNIQEALVMEAAFIITNNQNTMLNPDQLSAWDSSKNLAVEGLPFVALGAALGTTIDAIRLYGAAKGAFRAAESGSNADLRVVMQDAITTFAPAGDTLYDATRVSKLLVDDPKYAIDVTDPVAVATRAKAQEQADTFMKEATVRLNNADEAGLAMISQVAAKPSDLDRITVFGNLQSVERPSLAHFDEQLASYNGRGAVTGKSLEDAQGFSEQMQVLTDLNRASLQGQTSLWQAIAGQLTSTAGSKMLRQMFDYGVSIRDTKLINVLKAASIIARKAGRLPKAQAAMLNIEGKLAGQGVLINGLHIPQELADDLLAAVSGLAARLQHTTSGADAARAYPALAKLLDQHGAYTKSWDATTAWYNVRTGRSLTGMIPRAQDIGKVTQVGGGMRIEGTALEYTYRTDATDPLKVIAANSRAKAELDGIDVTLEVSAHHAAAAQRPMAAYRAVPATPKDVAGAPVEYRAPVSDLPSIERVATGMADQDTVRLTSLNGAGQAMTKAEATAYLIAQKEAGRAAYQMAGYNEQQIAVLLNTGEKFALGQAADDVILMGKMDYSQAESVMLRYKKYGAKQVDLAARNFDGIMARTELQHQASEKAFGKVLGVASTLFPEEDLGLLRTLSATELRAGMFNSATSEFGKFREWANYVGSLTHGQKDASRQVIERALHGHLTALSKDTDEAVAGRAQLALFNNMARRDQYRVFRLADNDGGTHMVIKVADYGDFMKAQLKQGYTEEQALELLTTRGIANGLVGSKKAMLLKKDVGELVDTHMALNRKHIENDFALAAAKGRSVSRDPDIYYAPPVNLRVTPFFKFVIPKGGQEELGRFMVYGANQAELEAKVAYATQQYGGTHRIVSQAEVSLEKQLRGEYDAGKVFSDYDFDPELARMGRASEALPSLDIEAAQSLDLMRNWHHNKAESQIMQAVELKYASTIQALQKANSAFDSANISALKEDGIRTAKLGVYESTRRIMLDSASYEGTAADTYRMVNDMVSATGGAAIHHTAEAIRTLRGQKGVTQEEFDALTKELADHGFTNPYDNLTTMLARSEVISDGRELNSLMRLANTLVASTTLRLDFMNSALQIMSTPLLLHGAIKEAKLALKGTEAGRRLVDMTTVVNPANGVREPSAAKLMTDAIQNWFTKEGSEFAEELRKRFILTDYNRQYLEAHDYSSLNGRHTLNTVQQKVDQLATFGSKFTLHQKSEDMSRFMVAWSMKKIAETRGLGQDETYALIRNAVDKVHGVYRAHQRVQLFSGVIGQSIGLFQTYMFNVAQYMTRHISEGAGKTAAMAAFMQSTVFGLRSLPAFNTLNQMVADTNRGKLDIYTLSGTEADPTGLGSYLMYGLGSHALITPVDFFSRGDIVLRNNLVVPTNVNDFPAVSIISKAVANIVRTGQMVAGAENAGEVGNALAYGLAHNALNRPLQGLGTIFMGNVTTNSGTPVFLHSNYNGYDPDAALNFAAMGGRLLGGKPKTEAILLDSYYRRTAYQQEQAKNLADLGARVRVQLQGDSGVSDEAYMNFFSEYSSAGGTPENFHQFFSRNMGQASQGSVEQFRLKMQGDNPTSRAYNRLMQERTDRTPWSYDQDAEEQAAEQDAPADDGTPQF